MTNIPNTMTPAEAVARLYNRAKALGMGHLHFNPTPMSITEAQTLLDSGRDYFDYLKGRVMKVSVSDIKEIIAGSHPAPDFYLYDRDNGEGAALKALSDQNNVPPA